MESLPFSGDRQVPDGSGTIDALVVTCPILKAPIGYVVANKTAWSDPCIHAAPVAAVPHWAV